MTVACILTVNTGPRICWCGAKSTTAAAHREVTVKMTAVCTATFWHGCLLRDNPAQIYDKIFGDGVPTGVCGKADDASRMSCEEVGGQ